MLALNINGDEQMQLLSEANYKIPYILEYVTKYMTINRGDMLLTGSPFWSKEPLKIGDKIKGTIKYDRR